MAYSHVLLGAGEAPARVTVNRIGIADLKDALRRGLDDFAAMPTHAMFLAAIYPILGLLLARLAFGYSVVGFIYTESMWVYFAMFKSHNFKFS